MEVRSLPDVVRAQLSRLFWDVGSGRLDPERHEDFILGRLLNEGDWEVVSALRTDIGDEALKAFVLRSGRRLDRRTRRFFEVVFDLPRDPCTTTPSTSPSAPLFRP